MLLQFTAENFRSIREEIELGLRASDELPPASTSRADSVIYEPRDDLKLLRCSAIYGANASGKSNVVEAIRVAQRLIVSGASTRNESLGIQPFRLDAEHRAKPSRFEFYVLQHGEIYGYGFAADDKTIVEESLTMMIDGEEELLFSRQNGRVSLSEQLRAEQEDPQFLEFVARGTPSNQLFLYEAMTRNVVSEPLDRVFHWFDETLRIISPSSEFTKIAELADSSHDFRRFLVEVMAWADTGVHDITVQRRRIDRRLLPGLDFASTLRAARRAVVVESDDGDIHELSLRTHHGQEASTPTFDLVDESDGTRRLIDLAPMMYFAGRRPTVLVIDELDRSLHTSLAQRVVELFVERLPATSQLVFTTHDTNLLDCRVLRPDCIWFTEKGSSGATTLFSLGEFRPEQLEVLRDDFEQGYLQGRFGGIPLFGDPTKLGWVPAKGGEP